MWLRRAWYRSLWVALFALPLWILLGRAFFGAPLGYQFLAQIVLVPLLFVGQLALTLVVFLRPSARRARAVSLLDVLALSISWIGQLGIGFFLVDSSASSPAASAFTALAGASALPLSTALTAGAIVLTILAGVAALLLAIREAVQDARASFDRVAGDLGVTAQRPGWANDPEHTIRISPRS